MAQRLPELQTIPGTSALRRRIARLLLQHQRAFGYRLWCFLIAGVIWLVLGNRALALGCLCWPLLLHSLAPRWVSARPAKSIHYVGWIAAHGRLFLAALQLLEAAVTLSLFVTGGMPAVALFATGACLIAAALAQGGLGLAGLTLLSLGATAAFSIPGNLWCQGLSQLSTSDPATIAANGLGVFMVCMLSLGLIYTGYRRSLAIHQSRLRWRQRQLSAATLNDRLARYLPQPLLRRLNEMHNPIAPDRLHSALSWQRRWVAVAFVDLVEFTELSNRLAPEQVAQVLNHHLQQLDRFAVQYQCSWCRYVGDGALLLWGDPDPIEPRQQVARAVDLALQLPQAMQQSEQYWCRQGYSLSLRARVAIASGYCTLGDWGAQQLDYTVIGPAVNLAQRLQQHAGPDVILLDEASAALLSGSSQYQRWLWLKLKGFGEVRALALPALLDARAAGKMQM